jgi:hypothetical protein
MSGTYKKFRSEDISITPFDAHKDYLVYIDNFTGSYYEPYYEQSRIFDHQITSSAPLIERIVSLSVFAYDSEHDETDFMPKILGKYGVILSQSAHEYTTNGWYKRAIHDSLQGMYYTNPDDPCYTLDNSGYEKEFRVLNNKAQILSVPQKMSGNNIKKGSLKIQSGSGADRITLRDDGYGNIYDEALPNPGNLAISQSLNFVSKSIFSLNFNDLHNEKNKKISAISINRRNTFSQKDGERFRIKNRTRFFERSRYSNLVRAHNVTPTTHSVEGTFLYLDGLTKNPTTNTIAASESRQRPENQSMMTVQHEPWHDLRQNDNYTITMRVSCSAHQPSSESINKNGPYNFILSKLNNSTRGGYPFSIQYSNANANGAVGVNDSGLVGGIQASISDGITTNRANSTASVAGQWVDVTVVKANDKFELWIDGYKNVEVNVPPGNINNDDEIIIGARTAWKGRYTKKADTSNIYARKTKPLIEYFRNFQGGISNINIFNERLVQTQIQYGAATKGAYTNLVGNVFYNHGLISLTSLSTRYSHSFHPMLSQCTLSFENTHTIFEHEYACHIKEREYTYTMNPTIISESKFGTLESYTTGSSWSPYVTTIGLYDKFAQLVAVGKLSRPIKKSNEYDTTFVVTFDT